MSAHQFPPHPLTIVYLDHLAVVAEPAEAPKWKRSEKHLVSFLGLPAFLYFGRLCNRNSELILPKRAPIPLSCTSEGPATQFGANLVQARYLPASLHLGRLCNRKHGGRSASHGLF